MFVVMVGSHLVGCLDDKPLLRTCRAWQLEARPMKELFTVIMTPFPASWISHRHCRYKVKHDSANALSISHPKLIKKLILMYGLGENFGMKNCLQNSEYKNQMQRPLMAKCMVGLSKHVLMTSHLSKILSSPTE